MGLVSLLLELYSKKANREVHAESCPDYRLANPVG